MTADLLGITALLFTALCVLVCAQRWPVAANILWVGFAVRAGAALLHFYLLPFPDSGADAASFELLAYKWAQGGFFEAWANFSGPGPYLISWIIALFYAVTDRSPLLAQSLSVWMGTGVVLVGWLLIRELWGQRVAMRAGWVIVFFPTLILYSSIILREAYICFFITLGVLGVVRWSRTGRFSFLLLATVGFTVATLFHGAMIIGLLTCAFFVLWRSIKRTLLGLMRSKLFLYDLLAVLFSCFLIFGFLNNVISVSYIGDISKFLNPEVLVAKLQSYTRSIDMAAYPFWIVPQNVIDLVYMFPVRLTYFMFSPFPWDVVKPFHLLGLFDSLFYLTLAFLMWRNRKAIWADPSARRLLIILLAFLFVFGFAVGNFGTGIRHRAKFVVIAIALAAPLFLRIRWRRKPKI